VFNQILVYANQVMQVQSVKHLHALELQQTLHLPVTVKVLVLIWTLACAIQTGRDSNATYHSALVFLQMLQPKFAQVEAHA